MEFVQLPGAGADGIGLFDVVGDGELGLAFVQLPGVGAQLAPGGQYCGDRATSALRPGESWKAAAAI